METQNKTVGVPTSPYKKTKKKLIIGAVIGALLITSIALGATTNFFGMMMQSTVKATPSLSATDVKLSSDGKVLEGTFCGKATTGEETVKAKFVVFKTEFSTIETKAPKDGECSTVASSEISTLTPVDGKLSVEFSVAFKNDKIQEETNDNKVNKEIAVSTGDTGGNGGTENETPKIDVYFNDEEDNIGITDGSFYANICSTSTSDKTEVSFKIGDVEKLALVDLDANECTKAKTAVSEFNLSKGTEYTLDVTADPNEKITEANEDNNKDSYTFTTPAGTETGTTTTIDMYVGSISKDFIITIGNKGTADYPSTAEGTLNIYVDNANSPEWTYDLSTLGDQNFRTAESTATVQPEIPTESHTVKACIFVDSSLTDADPNNNCLGGTVEPEEEEVAETSDLYVKNISNDFVITIGNKGTADYPSTAEGYLYIYEDNSSEPTWTYNFSTLADKSFKTAGSTSTVQPKIPTESYTVKACIIVDSSVADADSTNDCLEGTVGTSTTADKSDEDSEYYNPDDQQPEGYESDADTSTDNINANVTPETNTTTSSWLKKYTVIMMKFGDLEGTTDSDQDATYTTYVTSDNLIIRPIESVLFEKGDDEYEPSDLGFELDNKIYDHWDGVIFLAYNAQGTSTPSLKLNVDGILTEEINSIESLQETYALNDGTDNAVTFTIIEDYKQLPETIKDEGDIVGTESTDVIADKVQEAFADRYEGMADVLESVDVSEGTDAGTAEAVNSLVTTLAGVGAKDGMTAEEAGATYEEAQASVEAETANGQEVTEETVTAVEDDTTSAATDNYNAGFTDVNGNSWYSDYVNEAEYYGVVTGYEDGTFKPNEPVTRAELVKMVLVAFEQPISTDIPYNQYFSDLTEGAWYVDYVNTAAEYGFVSGYSNGTFGPGNTVNRAEALKAIIEASGVENKGRPELGTEDTWTNPFSDVDTYDWFYSYVMEGYSAKIISGDSGEFRPADTLTRAEACKIIVNMMKLLATPTM